MIEIRTISNMNKLNKEFTLILQYNYSVIPCGYIKKKKKQTGIVITTNQNYMDAILVKEVVITD